MSRDREEKQVVPDYTGEDTELYSVGAKESSKLKFHRNPLKTVSNAAKTIRKSPKSHKKNSKIEGRVALMKVKSNYSRD